MGTETPVDAECIGMRRDEATVTWAWEEIDLILPVNNVSNLCFSKGEFGLLHSACIMRWCVHPWTVWVCIAFVCWYVGRRRQITVVYFLPVPVIFCLFHTGWGYVVFVCRPTVLQPHRPVSRQIRINGRLRSTASQPALVVHCDTHCRVYSAHLFVFRAH